MPCTLFLRKTKGQVIGPTSIIKPFYTDRNFNSNFIYFGYEKWEEIQDF